MLSNHLIRCCSLFLTSVFPSIRVFSSESALPISWPKYWSFSFSISPSDEYSGLISFRIDWLDLLAVQGPLRSLLQHTAQKHQFVGAQPSLRCDSHSPSMQRWALTPHKVEALLVAFQSHYFMANRWGSSEDNGRLYFLELQNHRGC